MHPAHKKLPRYQILRNELVSEIARGNYPEGSFLPGAAELAKRYDVSAWTVNQVIGMLTQEGLLKSRQGRRARVLALKPRTDHPRIAIITNSPDPDGKYDYESGPWVWTLHQKLLSRLLGEHNPALNLSYQGDWLAHLAQVDGVIALESGNAGSDVIALLTEHGVPGVKIHSAVADVPERNAVYLDYMPFCEQAATYFLGNGVKYFFVAVAPHSTHAHRFAGFRHALEAHGVTAEQFSFFQSCDAYFPVGLSQATCVQLQQQMAARSEPVGIVAFGDYQARKLLELALSTGKKLKKDVFAIGSSGLPESALDTPALSVLEMPFQAMADAALELLYGQIAQRTTACVNRKIPVRLRVRET